MRVIIWSIPAIVFIGLINYHFVPGGTFTITYNVVKGAPEVSNFAAKEPDRLIGTNNTKGDTEYFQLITTTPLYFDVTVPRPFERATVKLIYQNLDRQPSIDLGVRQPDGAYYYKKMAYYNDTLETLPDYWIKMHDGVNVLWQKDTAYYEKTLELLRWHDSQVDEIRKKANDLDLSAAVDRISDIKNKYEELLQEINKEYLNSLPNIQFSSVQEFLDNLPDKNRVISFNKNITTALPLPGYKVSSEATTISTSIRGKHELYTYIEQNELLDFTFTIQDINRHQGPDEFHISLFSKDGQQVFDDRLFDDGEQNAAGTINPDRQYHLSLDTLSSGIYKIVLDMPDDIFIKKIVTGQNRVVFKGNVYLAESPEYKTVLGDRLFTTTTLYTNSKSITARTSHVNSLQTLRVGQETVVISELHTPSSIVTAGGFTAVTSPKNDVYISGDGFFSFSQSQFFDPTYNDIPNLNAVENVNDYDFIISEYPQPQEEDGWLVAEARIEAPQLYFSKNGLTTVSFMFNLLGLPENRRTLKVKEVTVTFEKTPLTFRRISEKLKGL
ncbi:MAG TPA: hypothetical protein DIS62_05180 [Candidatus Kerfeldbacteria bacterium]|nr:MAG: hypothetical protein UY34_C0011G0009 [Parcubacteria group bacterium GW2011_GWA2_48_9]KKW16164.1 MAG: hypothetical protein UY52_C0009G0024 [Parcubacteria group bacterium GW2011_GWC2_49_9]HCM68356.1 hypothetical protein [Candidatus Kerfeldbacteria bacterium]